MKFKVGQPYRCPKCGSLKAKIVWISEDGKTIGVRCPRASYEHKRNTVTLVDVEAPQKYLIKL